MEFGPLWRKLIEASGIDTQHVLRWLIGYEVSEAHAAGLAAATIKLGVEGDVLLYQKRAAEIRRESEADAARYSALSDLGEPDVARGALG